MIIKKQFAAEFQIQLVPELLDALPDFRGLFFQVAFIVKDRLLSIPVLCVFVNTHRWLQLCDVLAQLHHDHKKIFKLNFRWKNTRRFLRFPGRCLPS